MAVDGSIIINTKLDTSGINKDMGGVGKKVQQAAAAEIKKLNADIKEQEKVVAALTADLERLAAQYQEFQDLGITGYNTDALDAFKAEKIAPAAAALEEAKAGLEGMRQKTAELTAENAKLIASKKRVEKQMKKTSEVFERSGKRIAMLARRVFLYSIVLKGLHGVLDYIKKASSTSTELTNALARMRGALATAFQPLWETVLPYLTAFVNMLTKVILAVAAFFSWLTGKNLAQSAKNAESLNKQADAISKTGKAADKAKKSLAAFDEINNITTTEDAGGGSSSSTKAPSFDFGKEIKAYTDFFNNIEMKVAEFQAGLGAFILAIGTILVATGANIPLGLGLMAAGAALLGSAVAANWNTLDEKLKQSLSTITATMGGFLLGVGAVLAFSGANIPLGIGLMVAGAVALGTAVALNWGNMDGNIKGALELIIATLGGAALGVGAILAFSGANIPLGIGLMIAGAAALGSAAVVKWGSMSSQMKEETSRIIAEIGGALLALGAILVFSGVGIPIGLGLMLAGALGLAAVATVNWDSMPKSVRETLTKVLSLAGQALIALGLMLLLTGAGAPLGVGMIIAGGVALASAVALNWDFLSQKFKQAFNGALKRWAEFKTTFKQGWDSFWKSIGNFFIDIWNGIVGGFEKAVNGILTGINWLIQKINSISVKLPNWDVLGEYKGLTLGFNLATLPPVSYGRIPRLAQGTVVPRNKPFAAMLGDNKTETEIVSPLSTMKQALIEAMQEGGFGGDIYLTAVLDGEVVHKSVVKRNNQAVRRTGRNPLLGV